VIRRFTSRYPRRLSFAEFARDTKTIDAVARNLDVIGEAVKNAYLGLDLEIVWDIIVHKIPELRQKLPPLD